LDEPTVARDDAITSNCQTLACPGFPAMNRLRTKDWFARVLPFFGLLLLAESPCCALGDAAPPAKVLNNFVSELLQVDSPPFGLAPRSFTWEAPRDGWLFVRSQTTGAAPVQVTLDGAPLHAHTKAGVLESMWLVRKGPHTLTASTTRGLTHLVARSIPALGFARYGSTSVLLSSRVKGESDRREVTCYDRQFLSRDVLPNVNILVGSGAADEESMLRAWKAEGKQWLVECGAIGISSKDKVTADSIEKYLASTVGFTNPNIDGVLIDEFLDGEHEAYSAWNEALRRVSANPKYRNKVIYPYCTDLYDAKASHRFSQVAIQCGCTFAYERYLAEPADEKAAKHELDLHLPSSLADWDAKLPGIAQHVIVCLGTFSQPPENLDINPGMNYKVFLDRQMNLLANDPRCAGLYGVMTYLSSYSDPEIIRWSGKLFRHYCIEGQTTLLSRDPLMLPHLVNGDFDHGLHGWTVNPSQPGNVAAKTSAGFSWLQGRYPETKRGDTVLWMKRSATGPNVVRQEIKSLEPGRLYTFRMCSGDYRDLAIQQKLGIAVDLEGADVLPGPSQQDVFPNCYSHTVGPYDAKRRAWMNYHWILFRARDRQATLKISDWASPQHPGGPVGQELMMNFVQVQPYDE
jgi:hypothetical protein